MHYFPKPQLLANDLNDYFQLSLKSCSTTAFVRSGLVVNRIFSEEMMVIRPFINQDAVTFMTLEKLYYRIVFPS